MTIVPDSLPTERHALLGKPKNGVDTAFFIVSMTAVFVATWDESFVLSTSREIASQLGQPTYGSWLAAGYNLGFMIALPTYGKCCNIQGQKRTLLASYCIFAIGCTLTGTALSTTIAIAGRIIAGAGGAGMIDLTSVLLNDMATAGDVAVLRSFLTLVETVGISSGAPGGSMLMGTVGWRWSFLAHVPIVLVCVGVTGIKLPADPPRMFLTEDVEDGQKSHKEPELDVLGILLLSCMMGVLVLLLDFPVDLGARHQVTALLGSLFVALGIAFLIREAYWARDPLIPLSLLSSRQFVYIYLGQLGLLIADYAILSNLANYYIRSGAFDMFSAGYHVVPLPFGGASGALVAGLIIKKYGRYKLLSVFSLALSLVSCVMMLIRFGSQPKEWEIIYSFFFGVGLGSVLSAQFIALTASITCEQSSTAITIYFLFQQVGMIIGNSLAASLLRTDFTARLHSQLDQMPDSHTLIHNILANSQFITSLPLALQEKIQQIFRASFYLVPGLAVSALIFTVPLIAFQSEKYID